MPGPRVERLFANRPMLYPWILPSPFWGRVWAGFPLGQVGKGRWAAPAIRRVKG